MYCWQTQFIIHPVVDLKRPFEVYLCPNLLNHPQITQDQAGCTLMTFYHFTSVLQFEYSDHQGDRSSDCSVCNRSKLMQGKEMCIHTDF